MKIYSKFVDYYDGVLLSTTSSDIVWERKSKIVNISEIDGLKRFSENLYRGLGYLFFCGTVYPYLVVNRDSKDTYYPYENLVEFIWQYEKIVEYFKTESYYSSRVDRTREIFEKVKTTENEVQKLQLTSGVPIFNLYSKQRIELVELNPCLKEIGFTKVLTNYDVATKLDYYLNNVLVSDKIVETFSDSVKLHSKGFDNTSFKGYSGKGLKKLMKGNK